jgi:outer membrane biosynthesis protein TonB
MRKCLFLIISLILFHNVNAQTTDSVTNKFNKIPFVPFDVFAKFSGGDFEEYIEKNVQYPADQIQNADGEIAVAFSVDKEGNVIDVRLLKNLTPAIDAEILRVFKSSPKWIPARFRGNNVKVNIGSVLTVTADYPTKTIKVSKKMPKPFVPDGNTIYTAVNGPPKFPGGEDSLRHYLSKSIIYPQQLLKTHTGGKVYLQFVIEKDGSISEIKAVRDPNELLTQETIRIMQTVKYIAGSQNGHPVRVSYAVGVNFDPAHPDKH